MYIGLHVKYPLFLSDFNETLIFLADFRNILNYNILWKSAHRKLSCPVRTDRHDETDDRFFEILRTRMKAVHFVHEM